MPIVHYAFVTQEQIDAEVRQAISKLGPEVVRIRYRTGEDHDGDPSLNFRIVLTDRAAQRENMRASIRQIERTLLDQLSPYSRWGLIPYFSYRSASEQADRNEPEWT